MVQWLRLHAPNAEGTGLNPGQGTKIPHAVQPKKNCFLNNYFLAVPHGKQDLPQPGIEPMAPDALGVQSLNHWTTRKQKKKFFFFKIRANRLGPACMLRGKCQMRGWTEDQERRG